jgi:hypothetical protein
VNLLGCVLFGISAVAGYANAGQLLAAAAANWTTTVGAACFLAVGLAPLIVGMTFKIPRLSRLVAFERALQREAADVGREFEMDARRAARVVENGMEVVEQQFEYEIDLLERDGEQELARGERELDGDPLRKRNFD